MVTGNKKLCNFFLKNLFFQDVLALMISYRDIIASAISSTI